MEKKQKANKRKEQEENPAHRYRKIVSTELETWHYKGPIKSLILLFQGHFLMKLLP